MNQEDSFSLKRNILSYGFAIRNPAEAKPRADLQYYGSDPPLINHYLDQSTRQALVLALLQNLPYGPIIGDIPRNISEDSNIEVEDHPLTAWSHFKQRNVFPYLQTKIGKHTVMVMRVGLQHWLMLNLGVFRLENYTNLQELQQALTPIEDMFCNISRGENVDARTLIHRNDDNKATANDRQELLDGEVLTHFASGDLMHRVSWLDGVKSGVENLWYFNINLFGQIVYTTEPLIRHYWLKPLVHGVTGWSSRQHNIRPICKTS